jgi:beta-lactamase class A
MKISIWYGPIGGPPRRALDPDVTHYAASTMKVAVLAALYASDLDLDQPVPVRNEFESALPGAIFRCRRSYDNDDAVWDWSTATLRTLARRMIVRSSNLATNIVLSYVGLPAVASAWHAAGAWHSVTARGIEDAPAREAGIDNLVTAADLAALLGHVTRHDEMREVLLAQERREDLAAGLPPGTRIAHKNGWVRGIRHAAGVVFPDDAPPYAIAVCTTSTEDKDEEACRVIAQTAAESWAAR